MNRTEILYSAMKDFTDAQRAARDEYMKTMQPLETAKGSAFYADAREKADNARREAVEAAKKKAADTVDVMLASMRKANSARKLPAPTTEQLNLLQTLKMRKSVTSEELEAAAHTMDGNGAGLAVLQEIAQENGHIFQHFTEQSKDGLPIAEGERAINSLLAACRRVLNGDGSSRAASLAARRNARMNGVEYNPDDLLQEAPYENERDFYERSISANYDKFAQAVND